MLYGLPPFYSRNTAEMYDRIVNKPLRLRPTISESARDILAKVCIVSLCIAVHVMASKNRIEDCTPFEVHVFSKCSLVVVDVPLLQDKSVVAEVMNSTYVTELFFHSVLLNIHTEQHLK